MNDRESTPARGTPLTMLEAPAVETNGDAFDGRREREGDRRDLADEELTKRALAAVPAGQSPARYARMAAVFSYKSAEHSAASFEAAGGALREAREVREYVQRLVEDHAPQPSSPPRPPLPSQTEEDLEVIEHTHDGTPVYKASSPQVQAIRETERRHAYADFAAGEEQRTNERIKAAVADALKAAAVESDARPYRFFRDDLTPAVVRAGLVAVVLGLGAAIFTAGKAALAFFTRH